MVRPIYPHELSDPDFSWLVNTFLDNHPSCCAVESSGLPVILINFQKAESEEDNRSDIEVCERVVPDLPTPVVHK